MSAIALAVFLGSHWAIGADFCPCDPSGPLCEAPVTKSYKIQPKFCPKQLVCLIPNSVPPDAGGDCCGPHGVPPIFASGSYVVVRQSVEGQKQVAKFLMDMGAYVPVKPFDD